MIDKILARNSFLMEKTKWLPDAESQVEPTSVKDVLPLFYLIIMSEMFTIVVFMIEIIPFDRIPRIYRNIKGFYRRLLTVDRN